MRKKPQKEPRRHANVRVVAERREQLDVGSLTTALFCWVMENVKEEGRRGKRSSDGDGLAGGGREGNDGGEV